MDRGIGWVLRLTFPDGCLAATFVSNCYRKAHPVDFLGVDAVGAAGQAIGSHLAAFDPSENASFVDTEQLGRFLNRVVITPFHWYSSHSH